MSKTIRSNTWACVFYPGDSAPVNYLDIINSFMLPVLLSPLHDPDKNNEVMDSDTGELIETRKKHQHLLIYFNSLKSLEQVKNFTDKLNGTRPFPVHSAEAMGRYFIHWDNPEKQQFYDKKKEEKTAAIDKILSFNGFEYKSFFSTYTNEDKIYDFIEKLVIDEKICNIIDLLIYLKNHRMNYEVKFIRTHTMYTRALLDGQYHKLSNDIKKGITQADVEARAMGSDTL